MKLFFFQSSTRSSEFNYIFIALSLIYSMCYLTGDLFICMFNIKSSFHHVIRNLFLQSQVNLKTVEDVVQKAVCSAVTSFVLPTLKAATRTTWVGSNQALSFIIFIFLQSQVNLKTVEDVVQKAVCSSVTSFVLPTKGGYPTYVGGVKPGSFMVSHHFVNRTSGWFI